MIEQISPENIAKIIAILISIITLYTTLKKAVSKKENLKIDYEFAEKFIAEEKWKNMHDYLLERAYLALSGKQLEASVIRFFLEQKDPSKKLLDYNKGARFLLPEKTEEKVIKIDLINKLRDESKYKWAQRRQIIYYFITASLALFPLMIFSNLLAYDFSFLLILTIWVISFGMLAFTSLVTSIALESAKRVSLL
jgi:hypothetical protein